MDFREIENTFTKINRTKELLKYYLDGKEISLSNSEKRRIQKYVEEHSSKLKFTPALNYILLGLLYDKEKTFETIRRKGILRYSKYIEGRNFPESLVETILGLGTESFLKDTEIQYFESILNLSPIYQILKDLQRKIIIEITAFSKRPKISGTSPSIVKTLLAAIEWLFMTEHLPDKKKNSNSIDYYTREEIAEGVSYIIYLKEEIFGFNQADTFLIDENYILSDDIDTILLSACKAKVLRELEILVDHFSYVCLRNKNTLRISPPSPEFEKSIRLGYIRNELQRGYDLKEFKEIPSFREDICDKMLAIESFNVFKYVDDIVSRYRIEIPEPVFDLISDRFLKPKIIYREEMQYLSIIFKEQFLDYDKLNDIKLTDNLSLLEFMILRRVMEFLYYIFSKKVRDKLDMETGTILRSLVPTFTKEQLSRFYNGIIDKQALNEYFKMLTWEPSSNSVFDVQYQPFIKVNDTYMISICTYAKSNSIRNIFASEYKRGNPSIMEDGKYDPISDSLAKAFEQKGFKTFMHLSHSFKQGGEIDFLALKDEFLFIAECKKFLHPTSVYELRTIYDGLIKASRQLALTLEALKDERAAVGLTAAIGKDLGTFKTIKTAIITNTRLFNGITLRNHPVRNVYELVNFMIGGKVTAEDGKYWIWEHDHFCLNDLNSYLCGGFSIFKGLNDSMVPKEIEYRFGKYGIIVETYVMNIEKAKNAIKKLGLRKVEK